MCLIITYKYAFDPCLGPELARIRRRLLNFFVLCSVGEGHRKIVTRESRFMSQPALHLNRYLRRIYIFHPVYNNSSIQIQAKMRLIFYLLVSLFSFAARAEIGPSRSRNVGRVDNVTMGSPPPLGMYVPVPTFFVGKNASNYNPITAPVDIDTQVAYSLYLAKSGITGLVLFGSTGEAIHVTNDERVKVISATRKALDEAGFKDYPLTAGTVTQIFEETIAQLESAKDAGAQWGVCLVPGYFAAATSQEGIIEWFTAIADSSPLPIMIYDYPTVSNNIKVTPATYAELAKHPNIVGAKLAHQDLSWHAQICSNPSIDYTHFHPYTGLGQQLLSAIAVGATGAVDVVSAFFPKSAVHLFNLASKEQPTVDEIKEAKLLQYKVSAAGEFVNKWSILGIKEAVGRLRNFGDRDSVRLPLLGTISDSEWASWQDVIDIMEEQENSL
ncbi:hypothetical protein F5X99DRAFT_400544 [Biscogniauxia marginata]|nr:hypothetical protein F5X99DRAFT_400544 [Biscogniauxia marginata]